MNREGKKVLDHHWPVKLLCENCKWVYWVKEGEGWQCPKCGA